MLHHGSVGRVQSQECYFMFSSIDVFFVNFHKKKLVFIVFISFFNEVSNLLCTVYFWKRHNVLYANIICFYFLWLTLTLLPVLFLSQPFDPNISIYLIVSQMFPQSRSNLSTFFMSLFKIITCFFE